MVNPAVALLRPIHTVEPVSTVYHRPSSRLDQTSSVLRTACTELSGHWRLFVLGFFFFMYFFWLRVLD